MNYLRFESKIIPCSIKKNSDNCNKDVNRINKQCCVKNKGKEKKLEIRLQNIIMRDHLVFVSAFLNRRVPGRN